MLWWLFLVVPAVYVGLCLALVKPMTKAYVSGIEEAAKSGKLELPTT